MSVETWGMMPKSQIDAEKPEEAITRMIDDHNDDPDAHLAEGQSLTTHRAAEIIDHIVGSVVADKWSHQDFSFFTSFESIDSWIMEGVDQQLKWPGMRLWNDGSGVGYSGIKSSLEILGTGMNYDRDCLFQTALYVQEDVSRKDWWGFGAIVAGDVAQGFGFFNESGVVKGYLDTDEGRTNTADLTLDVFSLHVYRAQFVLSEMKVHYYVDGIDAAQLDVTGTPGTTDGEFFFRCAPDASDEVYLLAANCFVAVGL